MEISLESLSMDYTYSHAIYLRLFAKNITLLLDQLQNITDVSKETLREKK